MLILLTMKLADERSWASFVLSAERGSLHPMAGSPRLIENVRSKPGRSARTQEVEEIRR